MKTLIFSASLLSSIMLGTLHAQIYADITVSHGGNPLGTFRVDLDYVNAPRTCANFIGLATGQKSWIDTTTGQLVTGKKYYDGLKFHRLIHNFMIQGGDPLGNGSGGPGYVFQDEFHSTLKHSGRYKISMANSGMNSNGSQFFILLEQASHLDDRHSVFGEVISGTSIIDGFTDDTEFAVQPVNPSEPANSVTNPNTSPVLPIVMESVVISGPSLSGFDITNPVLELPTLRGLQTAVSYSPASSQYTMSWNRKGGAEYFVSRSSNLMDWGFPNRVDWGFVFNGDTRGYPVILSASPEAAWGVSFEGITEDRLFTRIVEVDYGLISRAPENVIANGSTVTINIAASESVMMTFDGAGGGMWSHSGGSSGSLTTAGWTQSVSPTFLSVFPSSVARFFTLGGLNVTFDSPVGSESWNSFDLLLNFHDATSGWGDGSVNVPQFPPLPGGATTMTVQKRLSFTYSP